MNVKVVTGVYELALLARLKDSGMEKYCKEMGDALAPLTMPTVLAQFENPREVYSYNYWDTKIPGYRSTSFKYPKDMTQYFELKGAEPIGEIQFLNQEVNHGLFCEVNFQHPAYHELKAHMLIRDCFFKFLKDRVRPARMDESGGTYKVLHDSSILTAAEVEAELAIIEEAVCLYVAETMQERYNVDINLIHTYCIEMVSNSYGDSLICWSNAMLQAVAIPCHLREKIEANDFSLSGYSSKLCPNLKADVARFVHQAYDLVYSII